MQNLNKNDLHDHNYISSPGNTVQILKKYDIRLKKRLGQNFLIDTNILKKIARAAKLEKEESIIEIGCGIGSLTEILAQDVKKIICIEIDPYLGGAFKDIFRDKIGGQINLMEADAMRVDYKEVSKKHCIKKIVSNLPYKIAAPLILKILLQAKNIEKMYFTIQKDIAERLIAGPGGSNYNSYTVKANYLAEYKSAFSISRNCFIPVPHVDSVFIEIKKKMGIENNLNDIDIEDFFGFIDACFLHRRKKLINSIESSGRKALVDKIDIIAKMLHGIGKDTAVRAENLALGDYINLYVSLKKYDEY